MSDEENPFAKLFRPPPFESISELMQADAAGSLADKDFDRHLGWFVGRILHSPADCAAVPQPVVTYWATRLMQFDVWNGGFAQAAYNIPEWFDLAAKGYERLGRPASAERIRRAAEMSQSEQETVSWLRRRRAQIRAVFKHFKHSSLRNLAEDLDEIGWDITEERIKLAREHREAFAQLDRLMPDGPS
jgi:hypothetical protein